ncbi:hypothetical protein PSE_0796 [Pseudovibrio sp. FO-BEG1]|uniref:Lipoprotein n=1 Tax=Pseudovibrio denitrificans TaxID=258256 RepID=A0A1I7B8P0_9HYPH|nr:MULTISPECIES: hypothetical protein [Pseudovibrio]AEV35308.1 hypothetical protein PSE_0796 [Pseudovibrio sp. FO-BEG1]SFT83553.1 hypothetical protein SAMN05444141_103766 [Pseudovibrio denitrificans]
MKTILKIGVCVAAFSALVGCQSTTTGQGRVVSKDGKNSQSVTFQVTEEFLDNGAASVVATLSSGEFFTGKLVTEKKQTESVEDGFFYEDDDDDFFTSSSSTTYSSKAKGVLFSAARSMQCQITLSNPSLGFADGGVGQCKISTGETVPVQF